MSKIAAEDECFFTVAFASNHDSLEDIPMKRNYKSEGLLKHYYLPRNLNNATELDQKSFFLLLYFLQFEDYQTTY